MDAVDTTSSVPSVSSASTRTNWAGNYTYCAGHLDAATSVEDIRESLQSHAQLKVLGARHSFNGIADSATAQISLKHMDGIALDVAAGTVTVGAGVTYGQLAPYLDTRGFALANLASLPHIGVVGACATATHGSGSKNGNLSTAVRAIEIVTAAGAVLTLSPESLGERFSGAVVGLGALGIVTSMTLAVEPRFDVEQIVYEDLSFAQLEHHLEEIFLSGYSVSLFTDWQQHRATQVWIKRRVDQKRPQAGDQPRAEFFGARLAKRKLHPLGGHSAENCTEQMGLAGPWYERLPHFKMNFTPSSGAEIQSEYFVPREKAYQAILAVEELRDTITPHLFVTEFRTIAADDLWMSPCYHRSSLALHFTWKPEAESVQALLPEIEAKLAPFEPRPHWAKVFTMAPEKIHAQYAKLSAYRALVTRYDPQRTFRNAYLDRNIYGSQARRSFVDRAETA